MLLNLLIALMSQTFEEVQNHSEQVFYALRSQLLNDIDREMTFEELRAFNSVSLNGVKAPGKNVQTPLPLRL